jgi:PKD repeat protein
MKELLPLFWVASFAVVFAGPPARADDVTDIVITEVMYNPGSGDREEDFIELHNLSSLATYNLLGFQFTSGVVFTFPDVDLPPKGYLVVCANQQRIRQIHGITNTVGDWDPTTTLDNGGERIKLVNTSLVEVEDFTYDDRTPWPILADGLGHSLERRNPAFDNDNPANWSASQVGSGWTRVSITKLATSSTLYMYLTDAGTAYVDDVKLYPVGNPGDERIQNGGFETTSIAPWAANGNHSGSASTTAEARSGNRSLRVSATGAGSSSGTSVTQGNLGLTVGNQYTLEFWVFFTEPSQSLVARLSQSDDEAEFYLEARGGGATAGRENSVFTTDIPPFVYPGTHSPSTPGSASAVTLLAQVADDLGVAGVTAHWDPGTGEQTAEMFDDGAHGDLGAGDGVYGVGIGSFPTGSIVRYWFTAVDTASQEGRYPFLGNPTPALGFYVQPNGINPGFLARSNSGLTSTKPAVYHILIDPSQLTGNPPHLVSNNVYTTATFVFNGEVFDNIRVRHRGQSSLGVSKKHWKVDFNKDHRFLTPFDNHPEVDNINIQSSYGDKSFLREWLAYKAWMDVGRPGLEMWHVRLYVNGVYRGLYVHMENADDHWMDRTGLDQEGWLWKSYSEAKGGTGGFEMEEDAGNPSAANTALGSFISSMNTLTGQSLIDYINTNMDVDSFVDFLAIHQLIHNCDHPAKNYFVYADEDAPVGSWSYYGWDMDLTHGRNFECSGGGVYNDTIRFDMFGDPQLLFGTSARPKCDGPWNGVINGFLNRTTAFRAQFHQRTSDLLNELYHPDVLHPIIDGMAAPLLSEIDMDWNRNAPYGNRSTPQFHVNQLKGFITNRYNYLTNNLSILLGAPDIANLVCQRSGNNALLSWTNRGTYQSIRVYRNNVLQSTLGGSVNNTSLALDLGATVNSFRVASVVSGTERPGLSCTIILTSGGYTAVIDEDFTPPAGAAVLSVNCNATQSNGVLQLTESLGDQAGSAFFLNSFSDADFIADFDLRFDEPSATGADGIAFIINTGTDTATCGAAGGAIGYLAGDGGTPVFPGFAIVFDTWQNAGEPSHNWAGFIDASAGGAPRRAIDVPEEFTGNGTFHATVIGKDGTFTLLLSNSSAGMTEREIFTYTVPGFSARDAFFGFSAGTGGAFARHTVDNFVLQVNTGDPDPVAASFTGSPRSGSPPLQVSFTNTSTGADTYFWTFGDGESSSERSPSHSYTLPGNYSVSLRASGPGGQDTHVETGYVTVTGSLTAAFTAAPTVGQAPLLVTFTNQSTGGTNYTWDFGDGATSTSASPTHTYANGGQYTVSLTARNGSGGEDTATRVNYIQVDGAINAQFTASPTQGEAPLTVQFTDTSTGGTVQSWLWDFGDGETSDDRNPVHVYDAEGAYAVSLQVFGFSASDIEVKPGHIRVGITGAEIFRRGDSNDDDRVDIADAIFILNYLFLGTGTPNCEDAMDIDDGGSVDLTDAVRLLNFLFAGGVRPEPPYPDPGSDPTEDDLSECLRG